MTTPIDISREACAMSAPITEAVAAIGYENDDGTLYGYANHKSFERNPGAVPVRIIRESDY